MLKNPATKYSAFPPIKIENRQWPSQTITQAPIWMSTDLRDGNQALFEPMNGERKMRLFKTLCAIGLKEIEVAFPSASQTDFDFVRKLIEENHIPEDVTIEVLAPAREEFIRRTFDALKGCKQAIVHIYNSTSKPFRDFVFGMSRDEIIALATKSVLLVKKLAEENPQTKWTLQYSPENFAATELDFALEVCNKVTEAWGATPSNKVILNLPATVEMATPNVHADQIEWMHTHLARRDCLLISLHPHNDRGCAVAAAELGLMAGADRVEGCLFGNGERTGNVDLVTLALNLYTQGIDPKLDFSDINSIARTIEHCTQMSIHPRHPYVGDLVFTAFSGSHQDAIKKGFAAQDPEKLWNLPYLPIDPADLGRSYDSIIRINSQSGKGGIAYLLEVEYGIALPRRLQVEFSGIVQKHTDKEGGEIEASGIWEIFSQTYLHAELHTKTPLSYVKHRFLEENGKEGISLTLQFNGKTQELTGFGNGPIDAAINALQTLGVNLQVQSYEERSMSSSDKGGDARACAFIELAKENSEGALYGVGIDANIVTASFLALISGANRILQKG